MVVLCLLYVSSTLALLGILHQFLLCWRGVGLLREGSGLAGVSGTYEISSVRWAINMIANVMWIIYGFGQDDHSAAPILIICITYSVLDGLMLMAILKRPPERSPSEKGAIKWTLAVSLIAVFVAATIDETLKEHRQALVLLPVLATGVMTALGRLDQIRILARDRRRGKLSLWECVLSLGDASLWTVYGLFIPKWEIWAPCLFVAVLDLIRWLLFVTSRKE